MWGRRRKWERRKGEGGYARESRSLKTVYVWHQQHKAVAVI